MKVTNGKRTGFIGVNKLYIGRGGRGLPNSPLANPYYINVDGNRDKVIEKYRRWLWAKICQHDNAVLSELLYIANNSDIELVCWCSPLPCHGDVIINAVNWLVKGAKQQ